MGGRISEVADSWALRQKVPVAQIGRAGLRRAPEHKGYTPTGLGYGFARAANNPTGRITGVELRFGYRPGNAGNRGSRNGSPDQGGIMRASYPRINKPRSIPVSALAGALGGLAASWVMNEFQSLWATVSKEVFNHKEKKSSGDDATVKTAKAISQHLLAHRLTEAEKKWTGPAVHYAFGALVGAAYGVLTEVAPVAQRGYGTAYGAAVWLAADEIAVPAFGLGKPPSKNPPSAHIQGLASHLVYGITTDLTRRAIHRVAIRGK